MYIKVFTLKHIILGTNTSYLCQHALLFLFADLKYEYKVARDLNNSHLPFGLAAYRKCSNIMPANVEGDGRYFHPANSQSYQYLAFTTSTEGPQFFYRWQQQRKMWWRKVGEITSKLSPLISVILLSGSTV